MPSTYDFKLFTIYIDSAVLGSFLQHIDIHEWCPEWTVYAYEVITLLSTFHCLLQCSHSLSRHLLTYIKVYIKVNRRFVIWLPLFLGHIKIARFTQTTVFHAYRKTPLFFLHEILMPLHNGWTNSLKLVLKSSHKTHTNTKLCGMITN